MQSYQEMTKEELLAERNHSRVSTKVQQAWIKT